MKFITVGHSMGTNMPVLYFSLWFQESLSLQRRGEEKKTYRRCQMNMYPAKFEFHINNE